MKDTLREYLSIEFSSAIDLLVQQVRIPLMIITDEIESMDGNFSLKTNGKLRSLNHQSLSIQDRIAILEAELITLRKELTKLN